MANTITAGNGTNGGTAISSDTSGILDIKTGSGSGTSAIYVDTSQKVGVGTSSPDALLTVNTVASFGDGSASAPSIAHKGDLNTGIYFSAADTVNIATGGTQQVTVDSSGNVGIGMTPSASSNKTLDFGYAKFGLWGSSSVMLFNAYTTNSTSGAKYFDSVPAFAYRLTTDGHQWLTAPSGITNDAITFTQAMTLDASGNLGIGTTSPSSVLHAKGTSGIVLTVDGSKTTTGAADTGAAIVFIGYSGSASFNTGYIGAFKENATSGNTAGYLAFYKKPNASGVVEAMRITSGGEFYIAGTTDQGAYNLQCNGTGVWGAGAYVNGSDARIKDDVQPISPSLGVVEKLNPVTFRYKESWSKDQSIQAGFIAQELLVALEGENYVDGVVAQGGSEGYYSVAYQALIPVLTKAIQEQQVMIQELQAKVQALENK